MKIQQAIKENKLVVFAGAGLSKNLKLPDWNTMVIDQLKIIDKDHLNPFISLLKTRTVSPIEVLEHLKNDRKDLYDYIIKKFNVDRDVDLILHKKLLKLSDNKVITTNYDNSFEIASNGDIIASKPTSKYSINEINNDQPFIFKIHGSFDEPDNCIIFKEDYEKLYELDNNEAAPEKLKNLFSNCTFLFVGFGFNDPDIDLIFDKMDKTFGGLNKHYILSNDTEKFKNYKFLEVIHIENFDLLEGKIDELLHAKEIDHDQQIDVKKDIATPIIIERTKIAILYPEILNQNFSLETKSSISIFEEIDADLLIGSLNINTLQMSDDYDLLIIISHIYKGKIYVEENNLKSNLISLNDILENLPNQDIPILFLTNEKLNIETIPQSIINIYNYKNQTIKRFLYKIVNDKCFSFSEDSIQSNNNNWKISLKKGKGIKYNFYGNDRNLAIGKKCLTNIIGRIEEQSNLVSRFLMINNSNKILNIKASGGLGKTTISKKIAYELYNRGYYKNGVNFKSCENVKNYDDFESIVIEGFNLADILNFREYLVENFSNEKIDLLVILDNFETVVNNLSKDDYSKVLNLLEFVSDYSNVVITSREVIGNHEFEEVFTLTPMTTDDALELFKLNYRGKKNYTDEEIKILRSEILEDLLANNPLAIKLVTTSRPEIGINQLRDQIKNHFFESINEEYSDVFKNTADLNIERSKSIFQSINYSYSFLTLRQKKTFELLSLFPDGIILSDFKKCFQKEKSANNITDTEVKQLENKSLLENYNGRLQLQPIIRRFADYQFNKHKENIEKYCSDAYVYNCQLLRVLNFIHEKETISSALKYFSTVKNNLLLVLEYIPNVIIDEKGSVPNKSYFLNYIYDLEDFLTNEKNINYFERSAKSLISYFEDIEDAKNLIDVLILKANYYQSEFDYSYHKMKSLLSVEEMTKRNIKSERNIEKRWKSIIAFIHSMEGFTIDYLRSLILNEDDSKYLSSDLYYLGIGEEPSKTNYGSFYNYEYLLRVGTLDVKKIKEYIKSLYMEEHLEIMQCTYTLSKIERIPLSSIQKLVVTNPYTRGLKNLMFAFNVDSEREKINYFEIALENLQHIKYYYLESLYYYTRYLKLIKSNKYQENIDIGIKESRKYKYKYLDHLFSNLLNDTDNKYVYNYEYYEIEGLEDFLKKHNEKLKELNAN